MSADRDRFEAIFAANYDALVRYAIRRVGVDGADEVVAETFLVAWRRLDDVPDHALPWLYATARRTIANELRRRRRAQRLGHRIDANAAPTSIDPADAVPERLQLQAAFAGLSERDREVLRLAEWERLAPADAALVLGCRAATYTVRLHRARRRLARALDPDPSRPEPMITNGEPA
jgi:RNA polymerase sigma-70 factor, ECF subfamily